MNYHWTGRGVTNTSKYGRYTAGSTIKLRQKLKVYALQNRPIQIDSFSIRRRVVVESPNGHLLHPIIDDTSQFLRIRNGNFSQHSFPQHHLLHAPSVPLVNCAKLEYRNTNELFDPFDGIRLHANTKSKRKKLLIASNLSNTPLRSSKNKLK